MEELVRLIDNISIVTAHLSTKQIQDVMITAKKYKSSANNPEQWNKVAELLWSHIQTGLEKMDDQLLCATCFFSVILLTDRQDVYMRKMQKLIETEITKKSSDTKKRNSSQQAVSLMYGMFQSSYLTHASKHCYIVEVIHSTFNLLTQMGYEYSQFTFIAFKTINAFKKVCGTDLQTEIYSKENQIKLLNLVNHNWENPITGIRDLVKEIFKTLVTILDLDSFRGIVREINTFYWNKAKYLMLSEIIESYNCEASVFTESNWIDGLIISLHKPGLVSAGADMYYAILNKINSEDAWCKLFLEKILGLLHGLSNKAIENFGNYWLLTTFKKIPQLMSILLNEFDVHKPYTDNEFYSILYLMMQGNKLRILGRNWDSADSLTNTEKTILSAIEHNNTQVRILAFNIICHISDKSLISQTEFTVILDYIKNNINSDCTVLRLNMLNSFSMFLSQLHIIFRNNKDNINEESLLNFCKDLQGIIIASLNLNGNYQRKCTNVKLINTVIDCLSQIPNKRKGHIKSSSISLKEFLQSYGCWKFHDESTLFKIVSLLKDPSDDIRDNANKLLINHYSEDLRKTEILNQIIQSALQSMTSKFFFEISCGRIMFKLIVNILLKERQDEAIFKSLEDVFNYGYKELLNEYELKKDVLKSIEDGKQLHSFISILQVVLETCIKHSYKLDISDNINELLDVLQSITNQFTWEQQNSTSSDFSKMNEIIENIIAKSGYRQNVGTDKDETKISGLHQIILNCLWLNVKASCDLAFLIMNYHKDNVERCEKCLNIITHVLETSRHKGAIEAAGTALGCGIQLLTSLPENAKTSQLPQTLLKTKLDILIMEASKMASITRRGAGLSIMVHRIVSSDMKKDKPLFHYFMKMLLKTCQNTKDVPTSQDIENQMDLPKAILIHFLTKIVMDSSLASDMMYYSVELAELAFNNLTSSHWQIRNAALQLYGALIPKLIGQKKASGTDDETIATVACDELRTHSPKLWKFITEQLKNKSHSKEMIAHSDLVPILNTLASCARRYNFSIDSEQHKQSDEEFLNSLITILKSPIHTVRRLAARCIFNIFSFENICDALKEADYESENFVHGSLMLMHLCHKYYILQEIDGNVAKDFNDVCKNVLKDKEHSYSSREIYASIHSHTAITSCDDVKCILAVLDEKNNAPGVFNWVHTCVKIYLAQCQWNAIPEVLSLLIRQNDFEIYIEMLLSKIETDYCIEKSALMNVADILLNFKKKFQSSVIWRLLYEISLKIKLTTNVSALLKEIYGKEISYKLRYIIPFAAKSFMNIDEDQQKKLANIIYEMSDFEHADVDMRYIAALANNELPRSFQQVSDNIKVTSLKSAIILLQDEDEDVRDVSVHYYKNIKNLQYAVHPNICLKNMLDYNFLSRIFLDCHSIVVLCTDLDKLLSNNNAHHGTDDFNPFANDSKNIYLEVDVLRQSLEKLLQNFE